MNPQKKIRIIKRTDRNKSHQIEADTMQTGAGPQTRASAKNATQTVARQVATWVKEFELRRKLHAQRNFASLFAAPDSVS